MSTIPPSAQRLRGRRVLVTGATGFIGRWVARGLSAVGAQLWLAARNEEKLVAIRDAFEIKAQLVAVDCSKEGTFSQLYREANPDVVFNLAGYGVDPSERDESLAWALNMRLVEEMAEVAASSEHSAWSGLRLVHAGTGAEYGPVEGVVTEGSDAAPISVYGRSKLAGTKALSAVQRRTGLRAITARLFTVYGPGEHPGRLLPSLLQASRSGEAVKLTVGQQQRDFTYVSDVVEGLLRLASLSESVPPIVNLATGKLTSVRTFAKCAADVLGMDDSQLHFGGLPEQRDEVRQGLVDTRQLRGLLDWVPACTPAEGIARTIEFETCAAVRT